MKRILGLVLCTSILFALSGCSASASLTAAQPKGGSPGTAQHTTSPNAGSTTAATSPLPTLSAKAPASVALNNAAATSPLPTRSAVTPPAPAQNGQAQMGPGVQGIVLAVDGATITVQDARQQSNVTVVLTDNTQVFKQTTITLADVAVGESLLALGSLNGDVFTAAQIRLGVEAAPANAPGGSQPAGPEQSGSNPPGGGQPPAGGQPPSGGQPPAGNQAPANGQAQRSGQPPAGGQLPAGRQPLSGTVKEVSSDTLTIETAAGSTVQVRLAMNGQIVRQAAGTSADITPNAEIMARGEQSGTTLTATQIEIFPAATP